VNQVFNVKELAEYLNLHQITVYKYVNEGKIPGFKIGSRWRFDKERIDGLLTSGQTRKGCYNNIVSF
jgi:excisionase family DNA binding protein